MEKPTNSIMEIKKKLSSLPQGAYSPSNRYWCITCKKLFVLEKPVCPYMEMCMNTPIPIEILAPENIQALEKFGLFYPKIPQKIMSHIITNNYKTLGRKLSEIYIEFLKQWNFDLNKAPLQTIKSFIILLSGCETAQRINKDQITFLLMDVEKIWKKEKIHLLLTNALSYLKDMLGIEQEINIDYINILNNKEIGKYFCAKCGMFFEFGIKREEVTCPLMPQKCMFNPQHIEKVNYSFDLLIKQFNIAPQIYKKLIKSIAKEINIDSTIQNIFNEWKINNAKDVIKTFM